MRALSIMQPAYLPWIGYVQRILMSDVHVILDHVKIDENNKTKFSNRNRILTPKGVDWLTIPYLKQSSPGLLINELAIDNSKKWQRKHWDKIKINYQRAPYFKEHAPFFEHFYHQKYELLVDAIYASNEYIFGVFGIDKPMIKSSGMGELRTKGELNLDLCQKTDATLYIAGPFSRDYLEPNLFAGTGIQVRYHDFEPVAYPQTQAGFTPYLSVIDLLFNVSPQEALRIATSKLAAEELPDK